MDKIIIDKLAAENILKESEKLKSFVIPKKNKLKKSKASLEVIDLNSQTYLREICPKLKSNCRDSNNFARFDIKRAWQVNNDKYLTEFIGFRKKLKDNTEYKDKEISDSLVFLHFNTYYQAQLYLEGTERPKCKSGTTCGTSTMGISVSRYFDITKCESFKDKEYGFIIMFKLIKGKVKTLSVPDNDMEPTPNFDCHQMKEGDVDLFRLTLQMAFTQSQIYVYGYSEDMEIIERPPQLCPIAMVNFMFKGPTIQYQGRTAINDTRLRKRTCRDAFSNENIKLAFDPIDIDRCDYQHLVNPYEEQCTPLENLDPMVIYQGNLSEAMTDCRFSFNAYEEKCKIAPPPIKLPARSSSKPLDNPSCFSPSHPVTASSSTCSLSSAASFSVCEDDASITTVDNDDGGTNPSDSSKTAVYEAHRMPDYPLLYTPYGQQQPPANQVLRDHCLVNLLSGYLGQGTRTLADEDTATGIDGAGQVPATTVPDTTLGINKAIAVRAKPAQQSRIVDGPSRGDARLRGGRPSCEGNLPRSMDARRAIYNDRCKEPRVPYIGPPGGDRRGQFIRGRGDRRLSYDAYGTRQRDRVEERELESNRLPRERIGGWDERIPRDRCSIDRLIHRGENSGMRGRRGDFNTIRGGDRDVDMRRGGGDRDMRRGGERDTNVWRGGGRDMDMRRGVERNMGRGGERDLDNRRGGEGNIGRGSERVVDIRRDMDMRRDMDLRRDMDMRRDMEMRRYVNRSIDGKSKAMKNPAVNMMRSDGPKTRGFDPGRRSLVPGGMIRGRTSIRGRGGIAATGTRLKGDVCGDSAANDHTVNISNHTSNVDKRLIVLDKTGIPGEVLQGDSRGVLGEEGKDAAEESCDTQNIAVESKQSDNDTSGNEELINPTGQPAGEKPLAPPTTPLCSDNISANLKQESDMLSVGDVAIDCSTAPPTRTSSLPSQQLLSNEASIDRLAALANELEGIDFELLKRNSHTWGCVQAYAKTPSDTAAAIGSVEPALDASPAHSDPVVKSAAFITPFDPNSNSPPVNNIMPYVNSRTPPSTSRMAPMHTHNPAPVNPHDPTPVHLHNTAPVTPQGPTPMHLHSTAPVTPYCLTPMHLHNTAPVTSHGPTPIHSQSPSIDHPNDPPPKQLQGPAPMHSQDPPPVHSHNRAPILPPAGQIPSVRPLPLFPSLTLSSQSNPVKSIPMASNHMTNPADPLAYKASGSSRPRKPPMDTLDAKLAALEGSLFRTTSGVDRFSVLSSMQSSISSDLNKPKPHSIGSSKTQRTSYEINGQGSSSEPESSSEDEISDEAADNIINFRD